MRFDKATIDVRPRGAFEVLDLALQFYRNHLGLLLALNFILGLPALFVGTAIAFFSRDFLVSLLGFWLMLPLCSGGIILAASRKVFGAPLKVAGALSIYKPLAWPHFLVRFAHRLVWAPLIPLGLVFGEILRLKWSFTPMILLLERLTGKKLALRRRALHRRGGANVFSFDLSVLALVSWITVALLFVADLFLSDILAVWEFGGIFRDPSSQPLKIVIALSMLLLASPIVDLAWFFYYLDARIRKEGWDLELGFRSIARRIKEKKHDEAA